MTNKPKKRITSSHPTSAEKDLLSRISRASNGDFITVERAADSLGLSSRDASIRLSRLTKRGWLRRAKRGLYYILPLEATRTEGGLASDPWILAMNLFSPCFIGGWSAAEHWELTEQLFQSTFVVTSSNERSSKQEILGTKFRVVRVEESRIKNSIEVWRGNQKVSMSDPEQTIVDGCFDPSWVGGFRHLAEMLEMYLSEDRRNIEKLVEEALARNKGAILKRLGFLMDRLIPDNSVVEKLKHNISSGLIKLDPSVKHKGKSNNRWGVWVNVSFR